MTELLCHRSLANVAPCGCTSRLKWDLDLADLTEDKSSQMGQTEENEIYCFCECKNGNYLFLWFYYYFFILFCVFWPVVVINTS